jgi:hypothetical protein
MLVRMAKQTVLPDGYEFISFEDDVEDDGED